MRNIFLSKNYKLKTTRRSTYLKWDFQIILYIILKSAIFSNTLLKIKLWKHTCVKAPMFEKLLPKRVRAGDRFGSIKTRVSIKINWPFFIFVWRRLSAPFSKTEKIGHIFRVATVGRRQGLTKMTSDGSTSDKTIRLM